MKKLFYLYKYWMRDVSIFAGEYSVAGRFVNEALALSIFLAVNGYKIPWWLAVIIYILGLVVMGVLGRMLRKNEIPHLTNTLNNEVNPELMKILKNQEEILRILKNYEGNRI